VVKLAAERLADLLDMPPAEVHVRRELREPIADAVLRVGDLTFAVECKRSGAAAPVAAAAEQARRAASALESGAVPIVVVPFMGAVGRERCRQADVAWLDLCGNARIVTQGARILVEGRANRFKALGRPSSAFAPKSARIARWLLIHPRRAMTQREIAQATGVDEGFTSRIVAKLEADDLVVRESGGAIRPRDPDLLLDAWSEVYGFSKHQILRGHVPARSGDELIRRLADELIASGERYAATGLAAAWLMTRFAAFRTASVYLLEPPNPALLKRLAFRETDRGANVWLVVPNDEGVLHGAADRDGVECAHPVQVYLDLKEHPERADEAADRLRGELLGW
jgi:hypothetical protein